MGQNGKGVPTFKIRGIRTEMTRTLFPISRKPEKSICLLPVSDTGYPHDGRADNTAYRHDRRADKRRYPHDREIDIQMLKMSRNGYILS